MIRPVYSCLVRGTRTVVTTAAAIGHGRGRSTASRRFLVCLLAVALLQPFLVETPWHGRAAVAAQNAVEPLPPPPVSARAVFSRDISAGVDLIAMNADEPLPPASTTKLATALVVVAHADLDEPVVIEPQDLVDIDVYSHMGESGLIAGDTLTVEQLLWGALLPSGSDAARALARHVGTKLAGGDAEAQGPVDAFIAEMNRYAQELGLANTRFVNPDGADAEGHVASARDLATLAAELLEVETLREMVRTPTMDVISIGPEQRLYRLVNTNELLGEDGVIGVKTGTEVRAGGCLVIATRYERNRVVTVVLGSDLPEYDQQSGEKLSDQRYVDMAEVLATVEEQFRWVTPTDPGTVPGLDEALTAWGVSIELGPSLVVPLGADDLTFRLRLGPPGEPEAVVGRVLFFAGSVMVGERVLIQTVAGAEEAA